MPTYIPVYQKKTDPVTGDTLYDENGLEIMILVRTIEVPDEPRYDLMTDDPVPEENTQ
jgi:hypothetical protein